jgi:hypothetical protein
MSDFLPNKVIRKYREMQDEIIGFTGQPAVFYRYEGTVSNQSTAPNPAQEFLEDNNMTSTRNIFADPVDTNIKVNWPSGLKITRNGQVNIEEEEEIVARIPFKLHPTIQSYLKTPLTTALDPENIDEDVYSDLGETDLVIRLEVVDLGTEAEDNTANAEAICEIKRTPDNLHPNDNDPLDDVTESDFFV